MLLEFLDQAQLDRVGCFAYSPVNGARANELPDAVPEDVKQERLERFMLRQAQISSEKLKRKIGRKIEVMVDDVDDDYAIARSHADAPEIDGLVFINQGSNLHPGDKLNVIITDAQEHDLIADKITD